MRTLTMGLFLHPHLTRGVMHVPEGAFRINRGIVDLPDELGESLGWTAVVADDDGGPELVAVRRGETRNEPSIALPDRR